jgi:hypothetical protein
MIESDVPQELDAIAVKDLSCLLSEVAESVGIARFEADVIHQRVVN